MWRIQLFFCDSRNVKIVCIILAVAVVLGAVITVGCCYGNKEEEINYNEETDLGESDNSSSSGNVVETTEETTEDSISLLPEWDGSIANGFNGGNGSESDPYQISNGAQLAYLAQEINSDNTAINTPDTYFVLTSDINLGNIEWTPIGISFNPNGNWSDSYSFKGIFDGQNYTIYNISIKNPKRTYYEFFGLFGSANGEIKNVNLRNVDFSVDGSRVGAVCGLLDDGVIYNVHVVGNVRLEATGRSGMYGRSVGGVVGVNFGSISKASFEGTSSLAWDICGGAYVGGIVGENSGSISFSCSSGSVKGGSSSSNYNERNSIYVGGLVGNCYSGSISNCYSTSDVKESCINTNLGAIGFIGRIEHGTVEKCFSVGNYQGNNTDDGNGFAYITVNGSSKINSCVAFSNVRARSHVYGFSKDSDKVSDCYRAEFQQLSCVSGYVGYDNDASSAILAKNLNDSDFYINTLGWTEGWDFSDLDVENGKYPKFDYSEIQ